MNKPIYFSPIEELSASRNLQAFIDMCRNELTIFGKNLKFDENVWDISDTVVQKGMSKRTTIVFSTLKSSKDSTKQGIATHENTIAMQKPFLNFAKAYIRYQYGLRSVKDGKRITALRLIEASLINQKGFADAIEIDSNILTEAANLAKNGYSKARAYRLGGELEKIGRFLVEKRIAKVPNDWKNPIKRPSDASRVGKQADEARNKKMPSKAALEALPEIFFKADTSYSLMVSSIIALLFGAPNRINEVFLLPYDCEVIQNDADGNEQYGLRWFPAKGAKPMIKWIVPSMANTIKEAIRRIKYESALAREVARWYDKSPDKIYLLPEYEYLRSKEYLEPNEASMIIFGKSATYSMTSWYKTNKIPYTIHVEKTGGYKSAPTQKSMVLFKDLESAVLKLLPKSFPYLNQEVNLKYADALVLQRINEYHSNKGTILPTVTSLRYGIIPDALGARESQISLFEHFGYTEKDGNLIKATSHQFRHYLNTLAQKGGASQLDIAKWSGRLDVKQNSDYDHLSADELLEMVHEAIGDEDLMSRPLANIVEIKKKVIITRDEYARLKVKTAHRTDFGICIHDFLMMPCQLHMDCNNCVEQVCMKGDMQGNARIRERKEDVGRLLEIAKEAHQNGHVGANRWIQHHSLELSRLTQICDILDDPKTPDGSFIQLSNIPIISMIEQADILRKENIKEIDTFNVDEIRGLLTDMGDDQ